MAEQHLTVLYDASCPLCRRFSQWLEAQPKLVPLRFVAASSADAQYFYPTLDHAATLTEITVIDANGAIYLGEYAWVMCLWATASYRGMAEWLSHPTTLPLARATAQAAAGLRKALRGGDYIDGCDPTARPGLDAPLRQG